MPAGVPWVQNQAQSVRVAQKNPAQTDVLREMQALKARMTPQQAQQAQTVLNEQLGIQARGVPDRFGERPMHPDVRPGLFVANSPNMFRQLV